MLPPINEPVFTQNVDKLGIAQVKFSHTPVRVKVVDCDYSKASKSESKLKHDIGPSNEELDNGYFNEFHYHTKLPVIFEPNDLKLSDRLKEKLLSEDLDNENAEILYIGDLADGGGSKQGHIVVHSQSHISDFDTALKEDQDKDLQRHKYDKYKVNPRTEKENYHTKLLQFLEVPGFRTVSIARQDGNNDGTEDNRSSFQKENIISKSTQVSFPSLTHSVDENGGSKIQLEKKKSQNDDNVKTGNTKGSTTIEVKIGNEFRDDEGTKIWEEVDAMIKRSIPNGSLWKYKKKSNISVSKEEEDKLNSIEFHPRFIRRGTERFHFISIDHLWDMRYQGTSYVEANRYLSEFTDNYRNLLTTNNGKFGLDLTRQRTYPGTTTTRLTPRQGLYSSYGNPDWDREQIFMSSLPMEPCSFGDESIKYIRLSPIQKSSSAPLSRSMAHRACKNRAMLMTSSLPRLTPSSTPLPTGITQPPPRSHSSTSVYVPYPPNNLSSSVDFSKMPQRINPLAPPPPRKRINWSWETVDQHHENEKRRLLMQKREHTRYHSAWSKAFYGAPAEKEAYRRHFRETLKQQMDDRDSMKKDEFQTKIKESERALAYDRQCQQNDSSEFYRKHNYLMQFRDGNKQQMEDRWARVRSSKHVEDRIDRERLRYNPINWSCSLK